MALALAPVAVAQALLAEGSCRDGQPHGSYQLRDASGQLRVAGAFSKGKRTGSFLFWSSTGARIAQLPFDDDKMSGTVALWYLPKRVNAEPMPKLEASFVAGRPTGVHRSWHTNGALRAEFRYERESLVDARAFNEAGQPLAMRAARDLASRDAALDRDYFEKLLSFVRDNLPKCVPASDRMEKS